MSSWPTQGGFNPYHPPPPTIQDHLINSRGPESRSPSEISGAGGSSKRKVLPEGGVNKKPRLATATACDYCRSRKLGCDENTPCTKCFNDKRDCIRSGPSIRSPLTRARMTELEDQLAVYELAWGKIFPDLTPKLAKEILQREGDTGASSIIRRYYSHLFSDLIPELPPPPQQQPQLLSDPPPPQSHQSSRRPSLSSNSDPLPPPAHLYPETDGAYTYEWHEGKEDRVAGQAGVEERGTGGGLGVGEGMGMGMEQEGGLDGMGSLAKPGAGVSYLGLSSGSTFLNAIRRLCKDKYSHDDIALPLQPYSNPTLVHQPSHGGPSSGTLYRSYTPPVSMGAGGSFRAPGKGCREDVVGQVGGQGRYLVLPTQGEMMPLVNSYFRYFHHLTPLVHEPTIRAQVTGAVPISNKAGSKILFYMILAIGAFDLASSPSSEDDGNKYYQVARQALAGELLERGTLELVQGLAIMANYLQRSNRPNAGYLCLGLAIRMATALGLHTATSGPTGSLLELEMRKRVWWCIVTTEAGCAVTFGRPFGISPSQLLGDIPLNCNDEEVTVSTMIPPPVNMQESKLYSVLLTQAVMAKETSTVHDAILQSNPAPQLEQIRSYDSRIHFTWAMHPQHTKQPDPDSPWYQACSITLWRMRDFRAILYRPLLLAAAWDSRRERHLSSGVQKAIKTCRTLSMENLSDILNFVAKQQHHERGMEWYTLYFSFQSCLTILLSVVWEPSHEDAGNWREILLKSAYMFRQFQSVQPLGVSCARILEDTLSIVPSNAPGSTESSQPGAIYGDNMILLDPNNAATSMDVERYWSEILGSQQPFADVDTDGWQQLLQTNLNYGYMS